MIGFIIALSSEAQTLLEVMEEQKQLNINDKIAYEGKIDGKNVIIAISGIGKVNAALTTQLIIDKYSPDFIINYGTCGGVNSSVKILNYYLIEKCCQYDFDLSELDNVPVGYIQDYDTVFFKNYTIGIDLQKQTLASADRFTCHKSDVDTINSMGCSLCDMEGGAIAQVCTSNKIPLIIIKGITDIFGNGTTSEQFYNNLKAVAKGFPSVIIKTINCVTKSLLK